MSELFRQVEPEPPPSPEPLRLSRSAHHLHLHHDHPARALKGCRGQAHRPEGRTMLDDLEAKWAEETKPDDLTALLREAGLEDPFLAAMWAESDDPDEIRAWLAKADRAAIFVAPTETIEVQPDDA